MASSNWQWFSQPLFDWSNFRLFRNFEQLSFSTLIFQQFCLFAWLCLKQNAEKLVKDRMKLKGHNIIEMSEVAPSVIKIVWNVHYFWYNFFLCSYEWNLNISIADNFLASLFASLCHMMYIEGKNKWQNSRTLQNQF